MGKQVRRQMPVSGATDTLLGRYSYKLLVTSRWRDHVSAVRFSTGSQ
jgi:hypothetical protein